LTDRPALVDQLHRAERAHSVGAWLLLSGIVGTTLSGAATLFTEPTQPGFGISLGTLVLNGTVAALGAGLYANGARRWAAALDGYNREAAAYGCYPAPLPAGYLEPKDSK